MKEKIAAIFKSYKFYLIIAVLAGIFFRLYGLEIQSLWYDELCTFWVASLSNMRKVFSLSLIYGLHPPLYHIFMYKWVSIFGNSEFSLRLPCAIAGILTIFFMYFMSRRIFDKYVATSATILVALSGSAIYYSQEARMYSILLLFSTISLFLWLEILKKIGESDIKKRELALYGFIGIITSYLHYFGTGLIFFQVLYLLFAALWFRRNFKRIFILASVIGLIFLPWFLLHLICLKNKSGFNYGFLKPDYKFFPGLFDLVFTRNMALLVFIPLLINIKEFMRSIKTGIKEYKPNSMIHSLFYLSVVPVAVFFAISQYNLILFPRYLIIILPVVYLLIAIIISAIPVFAYVKGIIYIFISSLVGIVIFLFNGMGINNYKSYYSPHKQQWREATKYVMQNYNNNSIILFDRNIELSKYYLTRFAKKNDKEINIGYYKNPLLIRKIVPKLNSRYSKIFFVSNFYKFPMDQLVDKKILKCNTRDYTELYLYECTYQR